VSGLRGARATSLWLWIAVLVAVAVAGALLLRRSGASGASALSPAPAGWLAAREYLERRGARVDLVDRPLEEAPRERALVLTFPWEGLPSPDDLDALRRRVSSGGTVVFAYSGQPRGAFSEELVAGALGLDLEETRGDPPLSPRAWWRFVTEEWRLSPSSELAARGAQPVVIHAPESAPKAPAGAVAEWTGPSGRPVVFAYARGRGRVVALPADALSNGRLSNPGNAGLLETLSASLGDGVAFDEYHHGLVAPGPHEETGSAASLDLLIVQLVLLYLLCGWALARRFGPAWRDRPEITGSTAAFLLGIGALHRRLRHSAAAALRLLDRAQALDPGLAVPAGLRETAFTADENQLLTIARTVARHQGRRRSD
jgi:hypothetical protein